MADYWVPADGHPDGHSRGAWFRFEGEWGYRTAHHPEGPSRHACLRVVRDRAYLLESEPTDMQSPFQVVGSFVYLAGVRGPPWFVILRDEGEITDSPDRPLGPGCGDPTGAGDPGAP